TLGLSYSRGALLALAVGLALRFWLIPLRLRSAAVLGASGLIAATVTLWVFAQSPLSEDNVALGPRATAGHQFGGVLILMLIVLYGAGLAAGFQASRHVLSSATRRRTGMLLIGALCAVPLVACI